MHRTFAIELPEKDVEAQSEQMAKIDDLNSVKGNEVAPDEDQQNEGGSHQDEIEEQEEEKEADTYVQPSASGADMQEEQQEKSSVHSEVNYEPFKRTMAKSEMAPNTRTRAPSYQKYTVFALLNHVEKDCRKTRTCLDCQFEFATLEQFHLHLRYTCDFVEVQCNTCDQWLPRNVFRYHSCYVDQGQFQLDQLRRKELQ